MKLHGIFTAITTPFDTHGHFAAHHLRENISQYNRPKRQLGIAGVKHAMEYRGYYGGPVRGPLLPLNETQKREIETVVNSLVEAD